MVLAIPVKQMGNSEPLAGSLYRQRGQFQHFQNLNGTKQIKNREAEVVMVNIDNVRFMHKCT